MINFKKVVIVIKTEDGKKEYLCADHINIKDITKMNVEVIEYKEVD